MTVTGSGPARGLHDIRKTHVEEELPYKAIQVSLQHAVRLSFQECRSCLHRSTSVGSEAPGSDWPPVGKALGRAALKGLLQVTRCAVHPGETEQAAGASPPRGPHWLLQGFEVLRILAAALPAAAVQVAFPSPSLSFLVSSTRASHCSGHPHTPVS